MSSLPTQPYRCSDFSGGLTENFMGGGPTRYKAADNFWVTVDRKLEERYGSQLLDSVNYQLPSGNTPVNALISHDNEQYLMGVACPNVYVLNPNWASILGPTGNTPLAGGNYQSSLSWGEWSHHTLLTDDSLTHSPVLIYRGAPYPTPVIPPYTTNNAAVPNPASIGNFTAITAGLPTMVGSQSILSTVLQNCIILANNLQTQMFGHINDVGAVNFNLHPVLDTVDSNLLFATPGAVDQTSLFVLIAALISAYEGHVTDVIDFASSPNFHFAGYNLDLVMPLNYHLSSTATPTNIVDAAAILDDMKTKFFMHQMAPYTHDQYTKYAVLGVHLVTAPHIGNITTGPIITPHYSTSIAWANQFAVVLNLHENSSTIHFDVDTHNLIDFPLAVDLDTLYVMIIWLRVLYTKHIQDGINAQSEMITATSSVGAGRPNLSSIVVVSSQPNPLSSDPVTWNVYDPGNLAHGAGTVFPKLVPPTKITFNSATTASSDAGRDAAAVETLYPLTLSTAKFHLAKDTNTAQEQLGGTGSLNYLESPQPNAAAFATWVTLLNQYQIAYNSHDTNITIHVSGGTAQAIPVLLSTASYSFAFHYFYQYMRFDGVIFDLVGPPILVGPVISEPISPSFVVNSSGSVLPTSTVSISNIPTLTQSANYDIANIQVKIFRTIGGGTTYYQEGVIPNGQTTFVSQLPDASNLLLQNTNSLSIQPTIYTSGGVVNFDPAPICKYTTLLQNTAYYGAVVDAGQTFLNRIRQSIQNSIWASPGSFFIDLPDILTGMSATRNNLVAFCQNSVYQISGLFNELGQGQMAYQSISDTIGCISSKSIVKTDVGIFFAGTDGFYYTDGFQLIKLSSEINLTYQALVVNDPQRNSLYGCYDRYNRRIWWSTQPNGSDHSPSQSYIFHLNFGVNTAGVFTTASNGENYRPSSMIFFQGKQIRGDSRGYLFIHSSLSKTDPKINILTNPTTWSSAYIPYNYASCAVDFGTTYNRKWLTRLSLQAKNEGNVAAQILSVSDNGRVPPLAMSPMFFRKNIMWGQPNLIWGAPNSTQPLVWADAQEMDMWRRFPATQLRADYKQIVITPAYVGVYRYQDWPAGCGAKITPSGVGTATVQILTPAFYTQISWPLDVVGYAFSQQSDGYDDEYPITALSTTTIANDTITVSDPGNELVGSTVAWVIRGYLKTQRLSITSYNIHFTLLGKMQQAFHGSQDAGENARGTTFTLGMGVPLDSEAGIPLDAEDGEQLETEP